MVALKTFRNLPSKRQQEIIAVCLGEFASRGYELASLTTILEKLGLAKGSFYRYFESKSALYFFLIDQCIAARFRHDQAYLVSQSDNLFDQMERHFRARLGFNHSFPLQSAFLQRALQERDNEEIGDVQDKIKEDVLGFIRPALKAQIKAGIVRRDIDSEILAYVILQSQFSLISYAKSKGISGLAEMKKISNSFIEVLKNGMSANEK